MNWADIAILFIMGLSTVFGMWRGVVKESLSLIIWIIAFWVAIHFCHQIAHYFAGYIHTPSLRIGSAFILLLILTLMVGGFVNYLVVRAIHKVGLGLPDRVLGFFFGIARGVLIVAALLLLVSFTPLMQDDWWHQSRFIPYFNEAVKWLHGLTP